MAHGGRVEALGRKRPEKGLYACELLGNRFIPMSYRPLRVLRAAVSQVGIEGLHIVKFRYRYQVLAPKSPNFTLYAALFVRALLARPTKLRFEQVVRPKRHETLRLLSLSPA